MPSDLVVNPCHEGRALVVGGCLAEGLAERWSSNRRFGNWSCDFIFGSQHTPLPDELPYPIDDYAFQIVQFPLRLVLPEGSFLHLSYEDIEGWRGLLERAETQVELHLDNLMKFNREDGILTFVMNFLTPQQNPNGRLLPKDDVRNFVQLVERVNQHLSHVVTGYKNSFVLDQDEIAADFGRKYIQDDLLYQSNHGSIAGDGEIHLDVKRIQPPPQPPSQKFHLRAQEFTAALWSEVIGLYRTVRQIDCVKIIIVDLDDTLWRGVIAEEGQISGETLEGWPLGVIEALSVLKRRGLLLAIVSKNDPEVIEELWPTIFRGSLFLEDFAVRKINWKPKVENIADVLAEVNLLPGSAVFVDDNPVERSAAKAAFPELRVLGDDLYGLRSLLLWAPETQVPHITNESARRTEMVRAQLDREHFRQRMSRAEFLADLGLTVRMFEVADVDHPKFGRALELMNKTNQFNTTGQRWSAGEYSKRFASGTTLTAFQVEDRFTDYGVVGCASVDRAEGDFRIEQFVMSCRVAGLDVEMAVLEELILKAEREGLHHVTGRLVPTGANRPVMDIFRRADFIEDGDTLWVRDARATEGRPVHPEHITLL